MFEIFIRALIIISGLSISGIGLFALYLTCMEYKPQPAEQLPIIGKSTEMPLYQKEFTFFTWNIGYGGLGSAMDFFYEGGKRVRPEKKEFESYFNGIVHQLKESDSIDFVFLQEVDILAKRSYHVNEVTVIADTLKNHCCLFGKNYDSRFIPIPLTDPIGRVIAGLAVYSRYRPENAQRIGYKITFPWPKRLFFLKRCFLVLHYKLDDGKSLVIINTHNSTFDKEGILRKSERVLLQHYMMTEYEKGNYVIAGGDWNNNPRDFIPSSVLTGDQVKVIDPPIESTFLPGWPFISDPAIPTNRDVDTPYQQGDTKTTVIDFFVVSPNVELLYVKARNNHFAYTDHNPVIMKIRLK